MKAWARLHSCCRCSRARMLPISQQIKHLSSLTPDTFPQVRENDLLSVAKSIKWEGDLKNIRGLVVHEDNHLLALYKPSAVLMQGDMQNADNLLAAAKRYLSDKYDKPGAAYLGLVHRLDRVTSGISVFAKTSKAAARLCDQFKTRKVIKYYLCVVNGNVELNYGECNHLMTKTSDKNKKTQILPLNSKRRDTVAGVLRYRVIHRLQYAGKSRGDIAYQQKHQTLLAVELETGRKHQIRAQLAHIGHPIVGDVKYGAPQRFLSRDIALHAAVLSLPHPTTLEPKVFHAEVPVAWTNHFGVETVAASEKFISHMRRSIFKYYNLCSENTETNAQSIDALVAGLDGARDVDDNEGSIVTSNIEHVEFDIAAIMRDTPLN